MKVLSALWNTKRDAMVGALVFVLACALYARTLAPSIVFLFDDTLEIHYVVPRLGILHPTGYPFYTLAAKLFTLLVPVNDPAFRLNLYSAFAGALAVALVYLVAQRITAYRVAALVAALTFAVGETFWAQAVAAEVYTTQMLLAALVLYLSLRYAARGTPRALYALAFAMGLGLTHHRLILLLYPALALYVLLAQRSLWRDWKTLARAALWFCLPCAFYLYLPLRGAVGSADGTYENTLAGFFVWVTGAQYTAFLTDNPFAIQRDAAYYWTLFQSQFTLAGLALAAIGGVWLLRKPREWLLLALALGAVTAFAFNYRTADVPVHFLTTFLLLTLLVAAGIDAWLTLESRIRFSRFDFLPAAYRLLLTVLMLLIPAHLLLTHYAANDLSDKWDVHDYGLDILSQPFEHDATIIGITGEMTLVRYFQETRGLRPDVRTVAADKENARLAAIENALQQNRAVYLTRPLKGAPEKYSLTAFGSLIRVQPKPATTAPTMPQRLDADFGAVKLLGYAVDATRLDAIPGRWHAENGKFLRVTLYWQAIEKIETDAMVSLKILRGDGRVVGQTDRRPVRDAYPTLAWRAGEIIADTYDVPLFLGVTPGEYTLHVTMYDAASGAVLGRRELQKITLAADVTAPRREAWNIKHTLDADFGALALVGYSLDVDAPVRPGDALPLTLLWRAGALKLPDNLMMQLWLEDISGKHIASRATPLSAGYPPFQWQPDAFVRDAPLVRLPANVADGKYIVKLAISRDNQLLGPTLIPFWDTVVDLGTLEVKNRARALTAPLIPRAFEATFDRKIKLLGYEWKADASGRAAQLTLYWRSLALMDTAYTVFVHLLDDANRVVASGDAPPGNGEFPTTGWIENEYITDVHTLSPAPPGVYVIEIGVYDPATGARLKTSEGQDHVLLEKITLR